uniref:Uncharacterized protein n=1 Tax=Populus trichocarpa TaxID=3694 RepID=A0A2K1X0L1_POPTR
MFISILRFSISIIIYIMSSSKTYRKLLQENITNSFPHSLHMMQLLLSKPKFPPFFLTVATHIKQLYCSCCLGFFHG